MLVLSSTVNTTLLLALLPLVLIDLGMVIYCIVDLYRPDRRVRGDSKLLWLRHKQRRQTGRAQFGK